MTIGQRIQAARKKEGLTQAQLAERCNLATITIQQYERDKREPRYEQLKSIAKNLNVDWSDLVPEEQQGTTVIAHIREKATQAKPGTGQQWHKMSDAEAYRAGFLQFNSEDDRIAYFYRLLNEDGKLAASACFFRHLDKSALQEVADYVLGLSENPLYQRQDTPAQETSQE